MTVVTAESSLTSSQAMQTILTDALDSRIANIIEYIITAMRIKLGTVKSAMIHECNITSSFGTINSRYTNHSHIKLLAWKEDTE